MAPLVIDPPASPPLPPLVEDGAPLWQLLYESLGYHVEDDEGQDYALRKFCEALCFPMEELHGVLDADEADGSVPYSKIFDVDECPVAALPYLAQYVGVKIQPEWTEEQIRNEIREPSGWKRGQPASIELAAQRHLTGTKRVILKANVPSVGYLYIRTLKSETPDEAVTLADINTQRPAWMIANYAAFDGLTYTDLGASYSSYAVAAAALPTYDDMVASSLP